MGLTSLHGQLTVSALTELGFSTRVAQVAAEANEAVDAPRNQGSDARVTNLHAMRGFVENTRGVGGRTMQTREQAQTAVTALLRAAQRRVVEAVQRGGSDREAAESLGAALHTVQDRAYHNFEPWPYESVGDSIRHAWKGEEHGLPAHYMLQCHAPRDIGYAGALNLSVTALDYSAGYNSDRGWSGTARFEVTQVSNNPWVPHLSVGLAGRANGPFGNEGIGYGLLTWGRIPSRPDVGILPPRTNSGPLGIQRPPALCPEGSEGANSLISARTATISYVNEISRLVNPANWQRFKSARL
jgi:hypothetical protein